MKIELRVAPIMALGLVMTLGGCLGSGSAGGGAGVGGGGSGGGSADFEDAYDAVAAKVLTADMPTSINATYDGQFKVGVNSGDAQVFGGAVDPMNAEILGDLTLEVAWNDGQSGNPFSGSATNIVATDVVSGDSIQLEGTLNVDAGQPGTISRTTIPPIGGLSPEVNTGSFVVTLAGDVEHDTQQGRVYLGLNGQFHGSQGEAMLGAVNGGVNNMDDPTNQIFDAAVGGTFYASQ